MSNCLGNPEPFIPEGSALSERAQLSMAPSEEATGAYGGQNELTEALMAWRPVEGRHGLPEAVYRPMMVTLGRVGCAEVVICQCVQDNLPASRGEHKDTLGGGDGLVIHAHGAEML